ncbi:probable methyltransferase-like protein 24 [Dreissena polymorpha]|nr:probable methyltransferase-like protein 24 [Dreissena polymorpha]XP_052244610.1 probable methyltransferase-like protein 24 [Dreissena polymorpha]
MIPNDVELKNMSNTQWKQIYWKYINRLQTLCKDVVRVVKLKDGGKEICADERYRPRAPCIIYSFGINNDLSFDNEAVKMFGCDVFCFDPSMKMESKRISDHVWFYNWGLSGENTVDKQGWKMKTLRTIRNDLGHSNKTIDILKMDIETFEWNSMLQMIPAGDLDDVRQFAVETHFMHGKIPGNLQLSALRQLYDRGFRIFMRDRNIIAGIEGSMTKLNEISLINVLYSLET